MKTISILLRQFRPCDWRSHIQPQRGHDPRRNALLAERAAHCHCHPRRRRRP